MQPLCKFSSLEKNFKKIDLGFSFYLQILAKKITVASKEKERP